MALLLKKTKELEAQIDEYLDLVDRGGLIFKQGLKLYLEKREDEFEERMQDLRGMESKGDALRREIERMIYQQTLIPESRGDVLGLLESTDRVLNLLADTLLGFSVESPDIPSDIHHQFMDLAEASISSVESLVMAIRSYFRDFSASRDYINKVLFYEKESDKISEKIKRNIFSKTMDLSKKMHLRGFAYHIELISDEAEDVCDRLVIAAIKRHI